MCWKSLRILTTGLGRTSEDFSLGNLVPLPPQNQASYWHSWLPAWLPWELTNSQGLLKVILRQFAVTLTKHQAETFSSNISKVFTETRDLVWAAIFLLSPFAQTVVKFAFKKDQHNALKVCYIRTWKNSNDGENLRIGKPNISMENDQWSNVCNVTNGILYRFINCSICPLSLSDV